MILTAAHKLLVNIARTITTSPLANPRHMNNVSINSRIALLTNAVAGHHLTVLDGSTDTANQQEQLLEISNPHMQAMSDHLWELTVDRAPDNCCLTSVSSSGHIEHNCLYDEKPLPCLTCPMLTRQMPHAAQGVRRTPITPPQAHKPNFAKASTAALRVMDLSEQWARLMLGRDRTESRTVLAAIAAAETVYYTSAAMERHPTFGTRRSDEQWIRRSEQVFDQLYQVVGGPPGPTAARPSGYSNYCTLLFWSQQDQPSEQVAWTQSKPGPQATDRTPATPARWPRRPRNPCRGNSLPKPSAGTPTQLSGTSNTTKLPHRSASREPPNRREQAKQPQPTASDFPPRPKTTKTRMYSGRRGRGP